MKARLIAVFVVLGLVFVSCSERGTKKRYPVLGREPIKEVSIYEDHSEALVEWAKRGFRDITVIHVDAHDDLGYIENGKIEKIKKDIERKDWEDLSQSRDKGEKGLYSLANYLYAASHSGMVKKVYWVMPFDFFLRAGGGEKLRNFLKIGGSSMMSPAEVDALQMQYGCLVGVLKGVDLSICGPETLPRVGGPVVLDIDIDFFPTYAGERAWSKLEGIKKFFDALYKRNLMVAFADISYSVNGGYLRPTHRWLVDVVKSIVDRPEVLNQDRPPDLWADLDVLDYALVAGKPDKGASVLKEAIERFPENLSIRAYDAYYSLVFRGEYEDAFDKAVDLCKEDDGYCYLLPFMGGIVADGKNPRKAGIFFEKAVEMKPGNAYILKKYGDFLLKTKQYDASIRYLMKSVRINDDMYTWMRLGDAAAGGGNIEAAEQFYEKALSRYHPGVGMNLSRENVKTLKRMVELFRSSGNHDLAQKAGTILISKGGRLR